MPFPKTHRYRLAGIIAPLFLISLILSSYLFTKVVAFAIGFGFFGDPIFQRVLIRLNRGRPQWYKLLELRKYVDFTLIIILRAYVLTISAIFYEASPRMLK